MNYTKENIEKSLSVGKYHTMDEWKKKKPGEYAFASKNKDKEWYKSLKKYIIYRNKDVIEKSLRANDYRNIKSWMAKDLDGYIWALKRGKPWFNEMVSKYIGFKHTQKSVEHNVGTMEYKSLKEWKSDHLSEFRWASKRMNDDWLIRLIRNCIYTDNEIENILKERGYEYIHEWKNRCPMEYSWIKKNIDKDWLKLITDKYIYPKHTKERVEKNLRDNYYYSVGCWENRNRWEQEWAKKHDPLWYKELISNHITSEFSMEKVEDYFRERKFKSLEDWKNKYPNMYLWMYYGDREYKKRDFYQREDDKTSYEDKAYERFYWFNSEFEELVDKYMHPNERIVMNLKYNNYKNLSEWKEDNREEYEWVNRFTNRDNETLIRAINEYIYPKHRLEKKLAKNSYTSLSQWKESSPEEYAWVSKQEDLFNYLVSNYIVTDDFLKNITKNYESKINILVETIKSRTKSDLKFDNDTFAWIKFNKIKELYSVINECIYTDEYFESLLSQKKYKKPSDWKNDNSFEYEWARRHKDRGWRNSLVTKYIKNRVPLEKIKDDNVVEIVESLSREPEVFTKQSVENNLKNKNYTKIGDWSKDNPKEYQWALNKDIKSWRNKMICEYIYSTDNIKKTIAENNILNFNQWKNKFLYIYNFLDKNNRDQLKEIRQSCFRSKSFLEKLVSVFKGK